MDRLEQARAVINRVDAEIAKLFEERLLAAREVAAYKKEHGLPILDAAREAAVIAHGAALIKDEFNSAVPIYASPPSNLLKSLIYFLN